MVTSSHHIGRGLYGYGNKQDLKDLDCIKMLALSLCNLIEREQHCTAAPVRLWTAAAELYLEAVTKVETVDST